MSALPPGSPASSPSPHRPDGASPLAPAPAATPDAAKISEANKAADKAGQPAKPVKPRLFDSGVRGADREFLPAALEILETPPAPLANVFLLAICAFFAAAIVWAYVGRLDVHAVAWGKIEPSGRVKVVQPLEAGRIAAINVADGDKVKAGAVLIELEDAEAKADVAAALDSYASSRAEAARRQAAIGLAQSYGRLIDAGKSPPVETGLPAIAFDADAPRAIVARERAVLAADRDQLLDDLGNIDKQIAQNEAKMTRLQMSIDEQNTLIATLENRVDMRQSSIRLNVGTKVNLYDAQEALQKSKSQLASDRGQQIETRASNAELASRKARIVSAFVADNESKLAAAARKADEGAQILAKARVKLERTRLTAPIDGVVQQMSATTIGQVVTTGQQLLAIVPTDGMVQVEVFVSNADIGFVKIGQAAQVKVDAFPFTRFGVAPAHVAQIAADAIDEQEARRRQSNATASALPQGAGAPGQPQVFVFPVRLALERDVIDVYGRPAALRPGMTVTAEIKTDKRRVIDYLLSPLARIGSEAMRER